MQGLSAVLSSAHVEHLARIPGHVAIHPDSYGLLNTTRTPKFLGLNRHLGLWPMSNFRDDMIIGIIDTGIWPESDSFNDKGMPPIPERWKGTCETGTKFNSSDYARRLAMYKVLCVADTFESTATDVLAGMDQAIADGVDLMSLSLGFPQTPYYSNVIVLGAFAAMERGIFMSCSAGNSGPEGYTIFNGAPWITTVGAGTIDRDYVASMTLGQDFATIKGNSFYPVSLYISGIPLYHGLGDATKENCRHSSLDAKEVNGMIVFCSYNIDYDVKEQMDEVLRSGAKGAIIATDRWPFMRLSDFTELLVVVAPEDEKVIKAYIAMRTKGQNLTVDIVYQLTEVGTTPAPQVAAFSSRGPNPISPEILKPDILAPGPWNFGRSPELTRTMIFPGCLRKQKSREAKTPQSNKIHVILPFSVSELGPEDTSRNIVEIIFQSSWLKKQVPICKIDRILKVHNTQKTITKFEDYRDSIKGKASRLAKKHPRCIADGNELLRFHCTTFLCSLGLNGTTNLCDSIPHCNVCSIIRNGFKADVLGRIRTMATSGRAHDTAPISSDDEKRAMLVCRVIAGRVRRNQDALEEHDSVAGTAGIYANLDELFVFNSKAILPCFVVIYRGF
ncbi:hypothetical protein COCNU_11G000010 [Cocos nucifera]|uniref:Peptidase S8/S53 domain-containing protein n=1 Tax=Cocos nucifera TaxID=13894 RepID=A0A8K0IN10_COCNU|nr:hypothetical protein COCNU_11G000010 [Cocos nucifera]